MATHDIAADGFYMIALTPHEQSLYVGIRSTFYRIAMITGQGLLIILAGWLEIVSGYSPVEFKVMNSPVPENERFITSQKDFILSSSTLYIAPGTISVDSVQNVVSRVNNPQKDGDSPDQVLKRNHPESTTPDFVPEMLRTPYDTQGT